MRPTFEVLQMTVFGSTPGLKTSYTFRHIPPAAERTLNFDHYEDMSDVLYDGWQLVSVEPSEEGAAGRRVRVFWFQRMVG